MRVCWRLHDHQGLHPGIKDYIRERERRGHEVFVPRAYPPGQAQAGFGEALVRIGGVEQKAHFFVPDLPHSDACYVRAFPAVVAEALVDGHIHAFAFFGAVPQSVLYDNYRCLVAKILPDGTRKRASLFSGFLSHYLIRDRYGRPGKGNDKGNVEGLGVQSRVLNAVHIALNEAGKSGIGAVYITAMMPPKKLIVVDRSMNASRCGTHPGCNSGTLAAPGDPRHSDHDDPCRAQPTPDPA